MRKTGLIMGFLGSISEQTKALLRRKSIYDKIAGPPSLGCRSPSIWARLKK